VAIIAIAILYIFFGEELLKNKRFLYCLLQCCLAMTVSSVFQLDVLLFLFLLFNRRFFSQSTAEGYSCSAITLVSAMEHCYEQYCYSLPKQNH
jgi:uncharacterized membrane protein